MAKVLFFTATQETYSALASKNPDALYFLTDVKKIYKGEIEMTSNMEIISDWSLVTAPIINRFYLNDATGEIRRHDGTDWITILPPVVSTAADFDDSDKQNYLANIAGIKAYVLREIESHTSGVSDVTFDKEDGLQVVIDGVAQSRELTGVAHEPVYESDALKITIPVYGQDDVVINLPKDNFVRSGRYEANYLLPDETYGPAIVLVVNDGSAETTKEVVIPAAALITTFVGGTTDSIAVTVSNDTITATARIKQAANNMLVSTEDGLMVDGSTKLDKLPLNFGGSLVLSKDDGTLEITDNVINNDNDMSDDEHYVIPSEYVVANAIASAISTLQTSIEARLAKIEVGEGDANKIILSTTDGITRSGKEIGGATLAENPNADTVATEAAVADAMSWRSL